MPTFSGRWESRVTVPTGGAAVSVTIPNGAGAATKTVAAGNYFLTQAGGVSSLTTALQSALNDGTGGYPTTAAAMAAAVGYGTWSSGWLFNIASGNDTGAFGGVTMTAVSTPTYGLTGPRSGIDKAVSFDAADAFSAGDNLDTTGTDDLICGWVGYVSALPAGSRGWFSKGVTPGWYVFRNAAGALTFNVNDAVDATTSTAVPLGEWHAGLLVANRATNKSRVAVIGLTSGTVAISAEADISAQGTFANADSLLVGEGTVTADTDLKVAAFYVGVGAGIGDGLSANMSTAVTNLKNAINAAWTVTPSTSDGRVSIAWTGYATPTWSLAWTSTTLRDVLGFTGDIAAVTTTQVSTKQSPMVWFPDSPLNCDDHPSMTPEETDLRTSESPTGEQYSLYGTTKYAHTNVRYQRVPVDRIRESSATYANASLEVFFRNCIAGGGDISWFSPGSDLQIYWSNAGTDALLGGDANSGVGVAGWRPSGIPKFSQLARPSQEGWVGAFDVRIPRLVSDG